MSHQTRTSGNSLVRLSNYGWYELNQLEDNIIKVIYAKEFGKPS